MRRLTTLIDQLDLGRTLVFVEDDSRREQHQVGARGERSHQHRRGEQGAHAPADREIHRLVLTRGNGVPRISSSR
jgi:hypothetical protein